MKPSILTPILLLAFALSATAADNAGEARKKEKLGYTLGVDLGRNFRARRIDFDFESFVRGFVDGLEGNRTALNPKELEAIKKEFNDEFNARRQEAREQRMKQFRELSLRNLEEGTKFLKANGEKEGVVTLASGLQYLSLKEGKGPKPGKDDRLKLHYRGMFMDGQEFESSLTNNAPIETKLGKMLKGWNEALPLMNEGSKWRLFLPGSLAHGEGGNPPLIGPNAVLIFEVELLSIER